MNQVDPSNTTSSTPDSESNKKVVTAILGAFALAAVVFTAYVLLNLDKFSTALDKSAATTGMPATGQKPEGKKEEALKAPTSPQPAAPVPATVTAEAPKAEAKAESSPSISVVQNCTIGEKKVVTATASTKPAPKPTAPKQEPPETSKAKKVAVSDPGRIWLWHPEDATASNPKPCIIERGEGKGLPPYCSGFERVEPKRAGEDKVAWAKRITGDKETAEIYPLYKKE